MGMRSSCLYDGKFGITGVTRSLLLLITHSCFILIQGLCNAWIGLALGTV